MSCCGSARRPLAGQGSSALPNGPSPNAPLRGMPAAAADAPVAPVAFVYTGTSRLAADGPVTRRRYRFEQPGAIVEVDGRDAASFAAIPNLRRARL